MSIAEPSPFFVFILWQGNIAQKMVSERLNGMQAIQARDLKKNNESAAKDLIELALQIDA
jgi:hypothetical protein